MNYSFTFNDLLFMSQGALITFALTISSGILGTFIGFLTGWARSSNSRIIFYILGIYIDIIRSVPLILQFVLFKFRTNRIKKTSNRSYITTIAIRYTHLSS